jgi:hypothetical protein
MPKYGIASKPLGDRLSPDYPIPAGHLVHIDSVKLKATFDSGSFLTALGHTFVPQLGEEVAVFYDWGAIGSLDRAPWEPLTVPKRRVIQDQAFLP